MAPHEQLDAAMNDRRLELRMTWNDLAKAAGISDVTLRAIRRGDNRPSPLTSRRIEDALHWKRSSIDLILSGGEARPAEEDAELQMMQANEGLDPTVAELRIEMERERARSDRLEQRIRDLEQRLNERDETQTRDQAS